MSMTDTVASAMPSAPMPLTTAPRKRASKMAAWTTSVLAYATAVAKLRLPITCSWSDVARIWLTAAATTHTQNVGPGDGSGPTPAARSASR
jgi:hypothetical protein